MGEIFTSTGFIIAATTIIIFSYFFGEISRKTNIPSVLMLILLGIGLKFGLDSLAGEPPSFDTILPVLGTIGLNLIVLEAALELELRRDKVIPILKALLIALIGLIGSTWVAALILQAMIPDLETRTAWLYATPLSILSSAIIIPSVSSLANKKKEFHIYESTFSDIMGIMLFYFLTGQLDAAEATDGLPGFAGNILLTLLLSFVASYIIILVFQNIKSHVKLFLLIAVLFLLYAIGKYFHLSSLIIILVFGLLISNKELFFAGRLGQYLDKGRTNEIYEGLHVLTLESAFVVRTFFFVVFGLTISLASLGNTEMVLISALIFVSIYLIRYIILRIFIGKDLFPQLFIAPRGLITILLFLSIPDTVKEIPGFDTSILFIIIATSIIMTIAMVYDKWRTGQAVRKAQGMTVGYAPWKAPVVNEVVEEEKGH